MINIKLLLDKALNWNEQEFTHTSVYNDENQVPTKSYNYALVRNSMS